MKNRINKELITALKAKDKATVSTLRMLKSELIKKEQEKNAKELTNDGIINFIKKLVKKQNETAELYKSQNRMDLHDEEMIQVNILSNYIPKQMSKEELKNQITQILADNNIDDIKLFGKAMGLCMKQLSSVSDGNVIKSIIQTILK